MYAANGVGSGNRWVGGPYFYRIAVTVWVYDVGSHEVSPTEDVPARPDAAPRVTSLTLLLFQWPVESLLV